MRVLPITAYRSASCIFSVLREYVLAGNPFITNADFVQLSVVPHHITPIGAGLYFVREFIENV